MRVSIRRIGLLLVLSLAAVPAARAEPVEQLGTVAFANSCDAAVQERFERAVALLHSFWWSEGDKAFRDVLDRDPGCAIATWGIAAIAIGNPFATGATPARAKLAQEAIARGRAISAKTERERLYIEAIGAYYDDFANRPNGVRLRALADAFEALAKRFPDDDETQIFAALYLIATQSPTDKTFARATVASAMLQPLFIKYPNHPGIAHYLIHGHDFPPLADQGLPAAICYAGIAPSAPHALHMPSHIFTRVGLWRESADTNHRAITAASAANESADELHALDYLVYADLQLARDGDAAHVIEMAQNLNGTDRGSAYARAAVPARYAVERGKWQEAARLADPDQTKFPYADAIRYFARAVGSARSGDAAAAEKDIGQLHRILDQLTAAKDNYWKTEVEVQLKTAEAWRAEAQGQKAEAVALMREAADEEDTSEKAAVSPGRLIPARELLGDMLLATGDPAAALREYEASQTRDPKRFRSLAGAAQAAAQSGQPDKARDDYTRLVDMAGQGDARPELTAARTYLAAK